MEALRLQTQQLSVRFLQLLGDHLSLIHHVRVLQDIVAVDDFFRPLFPVPFVLSFEGDDGQGEGPPSESSSDSDSVSGHSNPSYQVCTSVPNTSKSNLPLPVGCPYSRRSSRST